MKRFVLLPFFLFVAGSALFAQLGSAPAGFVPYSSDALQIGLYHPRNWHVGEQDGSLAVVSREALLSQVSADTPDLQPGDTIMVVGVLPVMFLSMMGIPADDVGSMVNGMFENMISANGEVANSRTAVFTHGGREVAAVTFDDTEQAFSGMMMAIHEQDQVVTFGVALGRQADLERNTEDLTLTLSTVEFTGDMSAMLGQ